MNNNVSEEDIQRILQGITIPPQPQILVDIHMEEAMPNPNIERISKLVCQDPALSGSILKVVNTCFRDLNKQITSIQQAAQILGLNQIMTIINGLSIKGELSDDEVVNMVRYWDTSMEVAAACATIAKRIGFEAPDHAYTLGLIHNSGAALLMKNYPNYNKIIEEAYANCNEDKRVIDTENHALNTNHAVLGYYIAKSWKLPTPLCEVIAEHHSCDLIFSDSHGTYYDTYKKTLLAILKMAEHIIKLYHVIGNAETDKEWSQLKIAVLEQLGMEYDDYELIIDLIHEMGLGLIESTVDIASDNAVKRQKQQTSH